MTLEKWKFLLKYDINYRLFLGKIVAGNIFWANHILVIIVPR